MGKSTNFSGQPIQEIKTVIRNATDENVGIYHNPVSNELIVSAAYF